MKMAICYTCDENIPEESIIDSTTCPECGGRVADRWGRVIIVEAERRQTDGRESSGPDRGEGQTD